LSGEIGFLGGSERLISIDENLETLYILKYYEVEWQSSTFYAPFFRPGFHVSRATSSAPEKAILALNTVVPFTRVSSPKVFDLTNLRPP
jgi:hypothetical protein